MDDGSPLIWVVVLLAGAFYFAVCETALSSASRVKIKSMADRGDLRARNVVYLQDNFDKAITSLLIYTNIIHIAIASIVTVYVTRMWGLSFVSLSTIVTTIVVFFLGEMVPKSVAKKNAEAMICSFAGSLRFFMKLTAPLAVVLAWIGNFASRIMKTETEITVTEDELYDIIDDLVEDGAIDAQQSDLISSALMFDDITIDSIMTPRVDMIGVNVDHSLDQIADEVRNAKVSRLPVYKDTRDNIIGVLKAKKFLKAYLFDENFKDVRSIMDPAYFTVSSISLSELLEKMTQAKETMAIISDNYGGTLGLVTVEDILEELVGEIWDEDDKVEEPIVKISDSECIADGEEIVGDVLDELGVDEENEADREEFGNVLVGEWIYRHFTGIPAKSDSFEYNGLHITIEEMEKNRIVKARFKRVDSGLEVKE